MEEEKDRHLEYLTNKVAEVKYLMDKDNKETVRFICKKIYFHCINVHIHPRRVHVNMSTKKVTSEKYESTWTRAFEDLQF